MEPHHAHCLVHLMGCLVEGQQEATLQIDELTLCACTSSLLLSLTALLLSWRALPFIRTNRECDKANTIQRLEPLS